MALWIFRPVAAAHDPRWQGRRQYDRVVVRARSPAFARIVARTLDTPDKASESGQQDPHLGSGFTDEKLYHVARYSGDAHPAEGPDEILETIERAAVSGDRPVSDEGSPRRPGQ
jgi:hypothetical protein